ncbi:methyltransferase domain-containing protein [Larkinella terrae]|uniref:Methyltransferase domain-containing protein n=1 Tax=Larkinella terrae TaxID=2025311 RepID=A0A7K0EP56_9BACT|nr:methyltransferase domain-containing protein [Larkinella terrae]MRS63502.1 methyltransferase domain-containing protein [Larkinella terrae]
MDWNADLYTEKHAFVFQYGAGLIDLLAPQPGEHILDLGCGSGELTQQIADRGAVVLGLDASEPMIAKARQQFPALDFRLGDATDFELSERFDAVFSNAVLHWITDFEAAIRQIRKHLKPGGRFVAEFGGKGNVKQITDEVARQLQKRGYPLPVSWWYFPSVGEYTSVLEKHGFRVTLAQHYDRDTVLNDPERGIIDWIEQFGSNFFPGVDPADQASILEDTQTALQPTLFRNGRWYADYKRLRVVATAE